MKSIKELLIILMLLIHQISIIHVNAFNSSPSNVIRPFTRTAVQYRANKIPKTALSMNFKEFSKSLNNHHHSQNSHQNLLPHTTLGKDLAKAVKHLFSTSSHPMVIALNRVILGIINIY